MATYTGNLNLKKPSLDDDALITDINNNMDILDTAANGIQDALAIVANGDTHVAITAGQYVYVRKHNTLAEGLYVASSNIAANAALSSSNLTADSKGGMNAISEKIGTVPSGQTVEGQISSLSEHIANLQNVKSEILSWDSIAADSIVTIDKTLTTPAPFGFVTGFVVQSNTDAVPLRVCFFDKSSLSVRLRNVNSSAIGGGNIVVYYV